MAAKEVKFESDARTRMLAGIARIDSRVAMMTIGRISSASGSPANPLDWGSGGRSSSAGS